MMYIHSNNEIDKRINVSKIANNISTMGDVISVSAGLQEFYILSVAPLARWCNRYGVVS